MQRPLPLEPGIELFAAETPTLPPATHTNSYAIGEREVVLVEPATPYDAERREWLAWARGLSSRGRRLVSILLTHHHEDHVGGAEFFARELGLPLWAHEETAAALPSLHVDQRRQDEQSLVLSGPQSQAWRVLHTPGHAPGHVCLFEPTAGAVIVGDMIASQGTILIAPGDGDMAEYLRQLKRLQALRARVALPAHGGPIPQPELLFAYYVEHRNQRERKVLAALDGRASGLSREQMLPVVYDDVSRAALFLAALSLESHLIKLLRDGRVRTDGERYFAVAD